MPVTLSVKITCQAGTRDQVKALWEKATKPHAEENPSVLFSCYSFAHENPDTIVLFEVLSDITVLSSLYQEEWFKKYLGEMMGFLAAPPEVITGESVWIKGS